MSRVDPSVANPTSSANTQSFLALLYTSTMLMIVLMSIWITVRMLWKRCEFRRTQNTHPPNIEEGSLFCWIYQSWSLDNFTFYNYCGIDALIYRMFVMQCIKFCVLCIPIAIIILIPVYLTSNDKCGVDDPLGRMSLNHIECESKRIWAAAISMWVYVIIAMYLFGELYLKFAYIADQIAIGNADFMEELKNIQWSTYNQRTQTAQSRTSRLENSNKESLGIYEKCVMIRDLPAQFWKTKNAYITLYEFLNDLFPGMIAGISDVKDVEKIDVINKQIQKIQSNKQRKEDRDRDKMTALVEQYNRLRNDLSRTSVSYPYSFTLEEYTN